MKQYAGLKACAVLAALAILGVAGVAEAEITIYVKNGSTATPVKVKVYTRTHRVVIAWLPSGVRKVMPRSTVCAIVDDGRESRVHILNKCAFTPDEFAKIQKVKEKIRKRSEYLKQLREEQRKASNAEWAAKALRKTPGAAPKSDVTSLPEDTRRQVFYDVVAAQDMGIRGKNGEYYVAKNYGLPVSTVSKIVIEGAIKQWPMPPR